MECEILGNGRPAKHGSSISVLEYVIGYNGIAMRVSRRDTSHRYGILKSWYVVGDDCIIDEINVPACLASALIPPPIYPLGSSDYQIIPHVEIICRTITGEILRFQIRNNVTRWLPASIVSIVQSMEYDVAL